VDWFARVARRDLGACMRNAARLDTNLAALYDRSRLGHNTVRRQNEGPG
jgi:hypothetical protein